MTQAVILFLASPLLSMLEVCGITRLCFALGSREGRGSNQGSDLGKGGKGCKSNCFLVFPITGFAFLGLTNITTRLSAWQPPPQFLLFLSCLLFSLPRFMPYIAHSHFSGAELNTCVQSTIFNWKTLSPVFVVVCLFLTKHCNIFFIAIKYTREEVKSANLEPDYWVHIWFYPLLHNLG